MAVKQRIPIRTMDEQRNLARMPRGEFREDAVCLNANAMLDSNGLSRVGHYASSKSARGRPEEVQSDNFLVSNQSNGLLV